MFLLEPPVQTNEPITIDYPETAAGPLVESLLDAAARTLLPAGNWSGLEWICSHPRTPESLLLELASIPELRHSLGHRKGPRALLQRLANDFGYAEAILTIAHDLYHDGAVTLTAFSEFIGQHAQNTWMLESLVHRIDNENPKTAIVEEAIRCHPDSQRLLGVWSQRHLIRRAEHAVEQEEIYDLYRSGEPKVWVALAANPHTPGKLLNELLALKTMPHASRIRHAAMMNLASAKKMEK